MTASDNFGLETFTYSVIITGPYCAYTFSTANVSYDHSTSIQIASISAISFYLYPICDVTNITCEGSPEICSLGSFNSSTKEWDFSLLDASTLGITSYPKLFYIFVTFFNTISSEVR